jgi:hypothetical protein
LVGLAAAREALPCCAVRCGVFCIPFAQRAFALLCSAVLRNAAPSTDVCIVRLVPNGPLLCLAMRR